MALTHVTATRNSLADVIGDQLNSGSLVYYLADATTEVATITLAADAFDAGGTGGAGIITMLGVPLEDTSATGNASDVAGFKLETSVAAEVLRGVIALSGADLDISSLVIAAGEKVEITSFTYESSS